MPCKVIKQHRNKGVPAGLSRAARGPRALRVAFGAGIGGRLRDCLPSYYQFPPAGHTEGPRTVPSASSCKGIGGACRSMLYTWPAVVIALLVRVASYRAHPHSAIHNQPPCVRHNVSFPTPPARSVASAQVIPARTADSTTNLPSRHGIALGRPETRRTHSATPWSQGYTARSRDKQAPCPQGTHIA